MSIAEASQLVWIAPLALLVIGLAAWRVLLRWVLK